jgi:predicted ferric reductase
MDAETKTIVGKFGWWIGIAVAVAPIVLWLNGPPHIDHFRNSKEVLTTLAKFAAFSGFAMYAWSLILGTRLRIIEPLFNGLDKVYRAHYTFGGLAIILITAHPVFLMAARLMGDALSRSRGLRMWIPGVGPAWLTWGVVALYVVLAVTFMTYRMNIKHQWWVRFHRLFGFMIFPSMLHVFLSHGHIAENPSLRRYLLVLSLLGGLAFLYHSVFGAWLIRRYKYRVQKVVRVSDSVTEVFLRPTLRPISYAPGQFAFVSFDDPAVDKEPHPYALTGHHRSFTTSVVVKDLGDYTSQLFKLSEGSAAYIEGPYGAFSYLNAKRKQQIWIAGGIGVTPFLAMARSLRRKSGLNIDMYYCYKQPEDAVYWRELETVARNHRNFTLRGMCETSEGFLNAEILDKNSGELAQKDIFICGPPAMMKALKQQLIDKGVPDEQIHTEEFSFN